MSNNYKLRNLLADYVDNGTNEQKKALANAKDLWSVAESPFIVFRHQNVSFKTLTKAPIISTTIPDNIDMLFTEYFKENEDCCLFEIHVQPGVHFIDVQPYYQFPIIKRNKHEKEIIIEGGGKTKIIGEKIINGHHCTIIEYHRPAIIRNNNGKNKNKNVKNHTHKNRKINITLEKLLMNDKEIVELMKNNIISHINKHRTLPSNLYNPTIYRISMTELDKIRAYLATLT